MKPRILIFSLVYLPKFVGGAEVAIKEITDRLSEYEFDMIALRMTKDSPKVEQFGNITVHRIGYAVDGEVRTDALPLGIRFVKYLFPFIAAFKAWRLNRTQSYQLIWSVIASYNSFGALFFKMMHPNIPFILTLQEGDPIEYIKRRVSVLYPLYRLIFKRADLVQPISEYLAEFARNMGAKCPVVVVPNAVDVKHFSQKFTDADLFDLKAKLGKKYMDVYLIHTGRLVEKNGLIDVIRALKLLPEEIKLLLLGVGELQEKLQEEAKRLGVDQRVNFIGLVSHAAMPKYLKVSDIFIRPSLSEGFGNSFVEAMAARIPVIATPVGGIVDFLFDRQTGILCKPKNPKSIAEAVQLLVHNPDLRRELTEEAFNLVSEKYDWNKIVQDMRETVFEEALKKVK